MSGRIIETLSFEPSPYFRRSNGAVYFIQEGVDGPVKVGWTERSVEVRMSGIQSGNPRPLRLLATMRAPGRTEVQIHRALRGSRLMGEWFAVSARLIELIADVQLRDPQTEVLAR